MSLSKITFAAAMAYESSYSLKSLRRFACSVVHHLYCKDDVCRQLLDSTWSRIMQKSYCESDWFLRRSRSRYKHRAENALDSGICGMRAVSK